MATSNIESTSDGKVWVALTHFGDVARHQDMRYIQELLGHGSIETSERYIQVTPRGEEKIEPVGQHETLGGKEYGSIINKLRDNIKNCFHDTPIAGSIPKCRCFTTLECRRI